MPLFNMQMIYTIKNYENKHKSLDLVFPKKEILKIL